MRKLRFEIEIDLDDLSAEQRAEIRSVIGCQEAELETAAAVDIKELGGMITCSLAWAEEKPENEFWAGSDMFARFAPNAQGHTVRLVGVRDMGAIAAEPRSAWGTLKGARDVLTSLKSLRDAMKHGNGLAAWHAMEERADRAIAEAETTMPAPEKVA